MWKHIATNINLKIDIARNFLYSIQTKPVHILWSENALDIIKILYSSCIIFLLDYLTINLLILKR